MIELHDRNKKSIINLVYISIGKKPIDTWTACLNFDFQTCCVSTPLNIKIKKAFFDKKYQRFLNLRTLTNHPGCRTLIPRIVQVK